MAAGVHDVLFRLIGDDDDARRALEQTAAELEAFARIHAEAEADVDTGEASQRLDLLTRKLHELDLATAEPNISTDIAGVLGQIETLQADLDRLDGEDVTIDVNMRRDLFDRLRGLTTQTNSLSRAAKLAESETQSLGQRLAGTAVNVGPFTSQLRTVVPVALAALGAIVSLVGAVAALAASLVEAVAGLGALAVAFGAVLIPAIGLGIAVMKDFSANADVAGTAAHRLQTAIQGLGKGFNISPGIHAVENALASVIERAKGIGRILSPAINEFARQASGAIKAFGRIVINPENMREFANVLQLAGQAMRPLAQIAGQLFRILLNIAQAALPDLISFLRQAAGGMKSLADATSNALVMRVVIGSLIDQFRSWLNLIAAVGRVLLGFIRAAAPAGQGLVDWLTKGANALADWVNSAEGQARLKQFFADVLPLAKQIVIAIGRLVVILIQLGEITAPILEPIVSAFNALLKPIIALLELINKIPAPIRAAIGTMAGLLIGFTLLEGPTKLIPLIVAGILALGRGLRAVGALAVSAFGAIRSAASRLGPVLAAIFHGLTAPARQEWAAIKLIVTTAIRAIVGAAHLLSRVPQLARSAFNAVRNAARAAWNAAVNVVRSAANGIRSAAQAAFRAVVSAARAMVGQLRSAVSSAMRAAVGAVRAAVGAAKGAATAVFHAVVTAATSALRGLTTAVSTAFRAVVGAIKDVGGAIIGAAKSLWEQVKSIIEAPISFHISLPDPGGLVGKASSIASDVGGFIGGHLQHGTSYWRGGPTWVGEAGPELLNLPQGAKVTPASKAGGGPGATQNFYVTTPEMPHGRARLDATLLAAQLGLALRSQGRRLG